MKQLLITTIAAVLLVGCGESATDTGKTDVQSTGKKREAELATFLPGKRIYFRLPIPGDPGVPIELAEPEPKLFSDEPKVEPGKKPTPPEIVWQFEKDGTIAMGVFLDGEVEFFDDEEMSYKVNDLDVAGFEDGKEGGGMTFSSATPKKGDKVLMGEKGQEKVPVTITRIEEASSLSPVVKTLSQPPASTAKPEPVTEVPQSKQQAESVVDDANPEPTQTKIEAPKVSIHVATQKKNLEAIKQHLNAGTDINKKDKNGATALHRAARYRLLEIVEFLIENGANVAARDDRGETPLHHQTKAKKIIEVLISKGADVNARDKSGQSSLHEAAGGYNSHSIVKLFVDHGADVNLKDNSERTPLHEAAESLSNSSTIELLIAQGAEINAKDKNGETPLDQVHKLRRRTEGLRKRIGKQLRPDEKASYKKLAGLFLKHGGKSGAEDSIIVAYATGNIETINRHLNAGVDANTKFEDDKTLLHEAASDGHKEIAELLISNGADVNAKAKRGDSPLHEAASDGHKEIAELLISNGADVNAKAKRGDSPLHDAAQNGHKEIVELLIAKGANVNLGGYSTPLDKAKNKKEIFDLIRKHGGKTLEELKDEVDKLIGLIRDGNVEGVKNALDGVTNVNIKGKYGLTPLAQAVKESRKEIAELLIAKGADVNEMDTGERTILHQVLLPFSTFAKPTPTSVHVEMIELLIANRANVNAISGYGTGQTPLGLLNKFKINGEFPEGTDSNVFKIEKLLRDKGGKTGEELSIHMAARKGDLEAVKRHLADGINVNAKDPHRRLLGELLQSTPMHLAARFSHKEILELLIAKGGDVNAKDNNGDTPLHGAALLKDVAVLLIAKGANVNAKGKYGKTPLHSAANVGQREVAELLIANGADVNVKSKFGKTPLDLAIIAGTPEVSDLLRKHGGKHGTIHGAARGGDIEVVKEFLATGTDVNAKSSWNGSTPLHHAAEYGHKEIAELLIAKGANVNAIDAAGQTPLDFAEEVWEDDSPENKAAKKEAANLLRKHGGKTGEELK
jgi:ankyrin repeat protein